MNEIKLTTKKLIFIGVSILLLVVAGASFFAGRGVGGSANYRDIKAGLSELRELNQAETEYNQRTERRLETIETGLSGVTEKFEKFGTVLNTELSRYADRTEEYYKSIEERNSRSPEGLEAIESGQEEDIRLIGSSRERLKRLQEITE